MARGIKILTGGLALLLHAVFGPPTVSGQPSEFGSNAPPNSAFVCQVWRVEDGLPHNTVTAIAQTRNGYLWVGTGNGLARFDGVQFRRFGLADGLCSPLVKALLEDRNGVLWIGTANGLSRYQNGQFTTWTVREGLAGNAILALAEDPEGGMALS
jgi:ligand-binding sensor domain-containing protein